MQTLIEYMREVLGTSQFYDESTRVWDYGAFFEYAVASLLLLVVVISVFKLIRCAFR